MKALGFVLLVVLCGAGYWFYQDSKQAQMDPSLALQQDPAAKGASEDLVASKTAEKGEPAGAKTDDGGKASAGAGKAEAGKAPAPEAPMSAQKRAEILKHWGEVCEAAMNEQQWLELSRQNQAAFGDLPEPDTDPARILQAFRGMIGSRIGIGDPQARSSRVEGGIPFAEQAMRNIGMAVREGTVKFRMEFDGNEEQKDGLLPAKKHSEKMLHYRWRVGRHIVEMDVDRISTVNEVLDMFDPKRFQG